MLKYFIFFLLCAFALSLQAQITLDGTLGPHRALPGPNYQIGAELGQQHGANLFHSFSEFNLSERESATFSGPSTVENIISRVTGGGISHLDGVLRSTIPQADFYFINPAGIHMGPHARLDISGSFHASTADVLRFEDGGSFDARQPEASILSVAPISSFGFLTDSPSSLTVENSQLSVSEQQAFSLIGGDITMNQAQLQAPFGHLNLASVAGEGEIALEPNALDLTGPRGNISIRDSMINLNGEGGGGIYLQGGQIVTRNSEIEAFTQGKAAGRGVTIQAEQFTLEGGYLASDTEGSGRGGDVNVEAGSVNLTDTFLTANVHPTGSGKGGNMEINARQVKLEAGGIISVSTFGAGSAGKLTLTVADTLLITGERSNGLPSSIIASQLNSEATGAGGDVEINAHQVKLEAGGIISVSTFGAGNAGKLTLTVTDTLLITGEGNDGLPSRVIAQTSATGAGGEVEINAKQVKLEAGGTIDVSTLGEGKAGKLTLSTADTLLITGKKSRILAQTEGISAGGKVEINAKQVKLEAGGGISVTTGGKGNAGKLTLTVVDTLLITGGEKNDSTSSHILAVVASSATGNGDEVEINAKLIKLEAGGLIAVGTSGEGNAGKLTLSAADIFLINGYITAFTSATGVGGEVEINANQVKLEAGGKIDVSTSGEGNAGKLILSAADTLLITGETRGGLPSHVSAQTEGSGAGGEVEINAQQIKLEAGGLISVSSLGEGHAGKLTLTVADTLLITGEDSDGSSSRVMAQADAIGAGGEVEINAKQVKLEAGGGISVGTVGEGNAGKFTLTATDMLLITGETKDGSQSRISAVVAPSATGAGSEIEINAQQVNLEAGGVITIATGGKGNAGKLILTIVDTLLITGKNSVFFPSGIYASTEATGAGGEVEINAQQVKLEAGGEINVGTSGKGKAGKLTLTATDILLITGEKSDGLPSRVVAQTSATGAGGEVEINAQQVKLEAGGEIDVSTLGEGNAGKLTLTASDTLLISGKKSRVVTQTESIGAGGEVEIKAQQVKLEAGGGISTGTFGEGHAGKLILSAADTLLIIGENNNGLPSHVTAQTSAIGAGGEVEINAQQVKLEAGGKIDVSTAGEGNAGKLTLTAADTLLITGASRKFLSSSGIYATTITTGKGGNVEIQAQQVKLGAGGVISIATGGEGDAGKLILTIVDTLLIDGKNSVFFPSGIYASSEAPGAGGKIEINAGKIRLKGGATINSESQNNSGSAGSITITTKDNIRLQNQGRISTQTDGASGGNISITTAGLLHLTDSEITTSVRAHQGHGGNIMLNPLFIVLDDSNIIAQAVEGDGGNMNIETNNIYVFPSDIFPQTDHQERLDEAVNASSQLGIDGVITVNSPDINIGETLVILSSTLIDASDQLRKCIATALSERNHFYVKRLPKHLQALDDLKPSRLLLVQTEESEAHKADSTQSSPKLAWLTGCRRDQP